MPSKYAPPSPPYIAARHHGGPQTPRAIVIHGTVSHDDPGTARDIASWWAGPTSPVTSAHYVVDPAEVIQCVGDHTIAYHCGYNTGSIAIELCDEQTGPATRWDDTDSRAILARVARLTAQLCLAYDISPTRPTIAQLRAQGPHGIYGHDDSRRAFGHTTHTDPGPDFPWEEFLAAVTKQIGRIIAERTPAPVKSYPNADTALAAADRGLQATTDPARRRLWEQLRDIALNLGGRRRTTTVKK